LPYEEIAARHAIPVGSIGPTRARLLARLRTLMERP
jgi:DNA-directed RNA polymerase specialized sigma24 family protein